MAIEDPLLAKLYRIRMVAAELWLTLLIVLLPLVVVAFGATILLTPELRSDPTVFWPAVGAMTTGLIGLLRLRRGGKDRS